MWGREIFREWKDGWIARTNTCTVDYLGMEIFMGSSQILVGMDGWVGRWNGKEERKGRRDGWRSSRRNENIPDEMRDD